MKWGLVRSAALLALMGTLFASSARADGKIGIVLMHGKLGSPLGATSLVGNRTPIGGRLVADLKSAGYLVATPEMCWSDRRGFDKPYEECLTEIDAAIADLKKHGATAIIVAGQSLGGNAALAYGAAHAGLMGVIAYAPADDPKSKATRPEIATVVAQAERLAASGKGDERTKFDDVNAGPHGIYTMELRTTARIYLSFYGPHAAGDIPANTAKLKTPLLWIAGDDDPTQRRGRSFAFDHAPPNPLNRYVTVRASHLQTPDAGRQATLAWLAELAKMQ
jgi:dienelactone hydrolase